MEKRIQRELKDITKDKESTIAIRLVDDSLLHLVGSFMGPEGTPYEGGRFEVDIHVPNGYPFNPLVMKMITKIYHPNISSANGAICLSTLGSEWSPVLTLRTVLVSLRSLLAEPQPLDPQDGEVAKVFLTDLSAAHQTARFWTEVYAKGDSSEAAEGKKEEEKGEEDVAKMARLAGLDLRHVEKFTEMGFPAPRVIKALESLEYRGDHADFVTDDQVLQALLG